MSRIRLCLRRHRLPTAAWGLAGVSALDNQRSGAVHMHHERGHSLPETCRQQARR